MTLTRLFGLCALLGGLAQLALQFLGGDWGQPGTLQYTLYESKNRLMAGVFVLLLLGFAGLRRAQGAPAGRLGGAGFVLVGLGWAMMITGTVLEFWFFTHLPYGALNARSWSWITVLLGVLVMLIGAGLWGWAAWRTRSLPRWIAAALLALLPVELALAFGLEFAFGLIVPTAALSVALGAWLLVGRGGQ
jgi:cell division protein FtsW (lipid II flippase)